MKLSEWAEKQAKELLGEEYKKLCASFDEDNSTYIRVNTLVTTAKKLKKILEKRGILLEESIKNSFKVTKSPFSLASTPEYLQGLYFIQDYSSMLPVLELDPKPGELVLDMAAAPGGKTTHMAELMNNQGVIVAIDINSQKMRSLKSNIQRMHVKNVIAVRTDARHFKYKKEFDKILLDAPCTGSGVIRKDKKRALTLSKADTEKFVGLQRRLVENSWNLLKNGGELVYATCSFFTHENEDIIEYAKTLGFTNPGKNNRLFTHKDDTQCFFYTRLVKL